MIVLNLPALKFRKITLFVQSVPKSQPAGESVITHSAKEVFTCILYRITSPYQVATFVSWGVLYENLTVVEIAPKIEKQI